MSKEINEALSDLAAQLAEQLRFYREIGITEIGGSAIPAKWAASADPVVAASLNILISDDEAAEAALTAASEHQREKLMPKKQPPVEQARLFGDSSFKSGEAASPLTQPVEPQDASLEAIREDLGECVRCKLHEHRTNIVFGEGSPESKIVFVGEGPGADEDATGRPFVGRAGQLLDKIIAAIGLRREDVYITNIVKCRPPGNRAPERDEVATCEQFLFRQLALIRPAVIVALGSPAFQCLLRTKDTITRSRGQWREWNGIKVMPTFHPAYLLRVPEKKREAWEDMKKVRDYLNSLPD